MDCNAYKASARASVRGFTLIELLVVISVIAVLASMLMPMMAYMRELAHETSCGNNQHQILLAVQAYASENQTMWPARPTTSSGTADPSASPDGLYTAVGTLELVAYAGNLPKKLFACPSGPTYVPRVDPIAGNGARPDMSSWAPAAAAQPLAMPGYAFDWSVPTTAVASRVCIADRGVVTLCHLDRTVVGCVDGHVAKINKTMGTPTAPTLNLDGSAVTSVLFLAADAPGDNIYDSAGDDGAMTMISQGSTTRCWVR